MHRESPQSSPLVVASFNGNIVAVQRRTGQVVWQWKHESLGATRLLMPPGRVVSASGDEIVCLAYATGALLWRTRVPLFTDTVLLDGDELIFGEAGKVGCLDVNTGALLWHHPFDGMGQGRVALGVPGNVTQSDAG